jgi:hypothetical protein
MPKEYLKVGAFITAVGWLLFRSLGVWIGGYRNDWVDMSPWVILFLLPPLIAAFSALGVGNKYEKRAIGMTGFYASAILFSAWPGFIATLVVLYSVTRRPFLLTSVWTALGAVVAITPTAYYKIWDGGDLLYAGGLGYVLAATAMIACVLLFSSVVSMIIHLVRKRKPNKSRMATPTSPSVLDDPT